MSIHIFGYFCSDSIYNSGFTNIHPGAITSTHAIIGDAGKEIPIGVAAAPAPLHLPATASADTFANLMRDVKGADKNKLALIGHTSGEMLRHYQDADLSGLRKIVNSL